MDFARLEKNIIDVIKEEQAKLGYRKEKIRLYYPLSSLNHFFQIDGDVTGMQEKLSRFSEYEEGKLGSVEVTNKGERFCFHIPEEGAEYVHNNMKENEFIKDLIGLISHHGCKMEDIFELFRQHSDQITIEEMHSDELKMIRRILTGIALKMKDAISFTIDSCRKIMKNLDLENNCQVRQKGEKSEAYNTWNRKCNRHGVL